MSEFPTFELIPPGEDTDPDEELAAFAELDDVSPVEEEDEAQPFGRSWLFDFDTGRMASSPQPVQGLDALVMWCQLALRTMRMAHPIFGDEYGMTEPDRLLGWIDDAERRALYVADARATLLGHDRVTDVRDFQFSISSDERVMYMSCTVEVDGDAEELEAHTIRLEEVPLA